MIHDSKDTARRLRQLAVKHCIVRLIGLASRLRREARAQGDECRVRAMTFSLRALNDILQVWAGRQRSGGVETLCLRIIARRYVFACVRSQAVDVTYRGRVLTMHQLEDAMPELFAGDDFNNVSRAHWDERWHERQANRLKTLADAFIEGD